MSRRARLAGFGSAVACVGAGAGCAVVIAGVLGELLAFVLIAGGLVLATSLAFLEIGLSEDRELEREHARRVRGNRGPGGSEGPARPERSGRPGRLGSPGWSRPLGRERAHRRRLG